MTDNTTALFNTKTVLPPIGKSADSSGSNTTVSDESAPELNQPGPPTTGIVKPKMRPPKLKTPMDLVISAQLAGCTSHHRPIGTPPPTSLRKPRHFGGDYGPPPPGGATHIGGTPDDPFDPSFPQINVENCLEQAYEDCGGSSFESSSAGSSFESSAFPALNSGYIYQHQHSVDLEPPSQQFLQRRPSGDDLNRVATIDNQRTRINSENNNQAQDFYNSLSSSSGTATSPSIGGLTPPQRLMARDQDGVVFELSSTQDRQVGVSGDHVTGSGTEEPARK